MKEKGLETPPVAGPRAEPTSCDKKEKSPDDRANLTFSGRDELGEPHWDVMTAWFISHFYFQLGVVWADDVIRRRHPAEIKTEINGKMAGEALQEADG